MSPDPSPSPVGVGGYFATQTLDVIGDGTTVKDEDDKTTGAEKKS